MNIRLKILFSLIVVSLNINSEELEIQVLAGKNSFDKKLGYKDAYGFGLRENIFFTKYNALQLSLDKFNNVSKNSLSLVRYSLNYLFRYRENGIEPFFLIGVGGQKGVEKDKTLINIGIGSNFQLTKDIAFITELKGVSKNDKTFDLNANLGIGFFPKLTSNKKVEKNDNIPETYAVKLKKKQKIIPSIVKPKIQPNPVKVIVREKINQPQYTTEQAKYYKNNEENNKYNEIEKSEDIDFNPNNKKEKDILVFDDEEYILKKY